MNNVEQQEVRSFLKKGTKRLLLRMRSHRIGHDLNLAAGAIVKVFWFFSSEKNCFLPQATYST